MDNRNNRDNLKIIQMPERSIPKRDSDHLNLSDRIDLRKIATYSQIPEARDIIKKNIELIELSFRDEIDSLPPVDNVNNINCDLSPEMYDILTQIESNYDLKRIVQAEIMIMNYRRLSVNQ